MALGKDRKFGMYFYRLHSHGYKSIVDYGRILADLRYRKHKFVRVTKEKSGYALWIR